MTPILSMSHPRVQKLVPTHAILALHRSTQRKHVFPIAKLPRGWKFLKVIPVNAVGMTRSEVISKLNQKLDKQVNFNKPPLPIAEVYHAEHTLNVSPPVGVETVNEEKSYLTIQQIDSFLWTHNTMLGKYVKLEMRDIARHLDRIQADEHQYIIWGKNQNSGFQLEVNGIGKIINVSARWKD